MGVLNIGRYTYWKQILPGAATYVAGKVDAIRDFSEGISRLVEAFNAENNFGGLLTKEEIREWLASKGITEKDLPIWLTKANTKLEFLVESLFKKLRGKDGSPKPADEPAAPPPPGEGTVR